MLILPAVLLFAGVCMLYFLSIPSAGVSQVSLGYPTLGRVSLQEELFFQHLILLFTHLDVVWEFTSPSSKDNYSQLPLCPGTSPMVAAHQPFVDFLKPKNALV